MNSSDTPAKVGSSEGLDAGSEAGCICRGNWRAIVAETEKLIGRKYRGHDGKKYTFFGIVHGGDDYYYGLHRAGKLRLLSCVGSIEGHGYTPVDDMISVHALRAIVVEALREATGCPDLKGNDGKYLVDKIEAVALHAARSV